MGNWRDVDNDVLKTVMRNFALNANILAWSKQEALAEKYGCNIPMTMLIDPTSACNLKCTGGEPLVRKADLIRLCEEHDDCQFAAFTNVMLIDEAFANDLLRVKNFIPIISVEGFEKDTDFRCWQRYVW